MRAAIRLFKRRWQKYIDNDPDLNPNINRDNAFYEVDTKIARYDYPKSQLKKK